MPVRSTPGDVAGSLVITPAGQQAQTVPVTLRTLVPSKAGTFSGVLTGGNGRASFTGVTDYYQVDVVKGSSGLNASLKLADNPNNQAYVWLIDPSGQAQAFQSNGVVTSDSSGHLTYTNTLGATAHVLAPVTGRWTIIVTFAPTVSGTALREPFTMSVNETAEKVTATGVPHGQSASVNNPAVVQVKVTNHSAAPEAYFIDGRTTSSTRYRLAPLTGASTTVPLNVTRNIPEYLVPSQTSELDATAGNDRERADPVRHECPDRRPRRGLRTGTHRVGRAARIAGHRRGVGDRADHRRAVRPHRCDPGERHHHADGHHPGPSTLR